MTRWCINIWIWLFKVALRQNLIFHKLRSRSIHSDTPPIDFLIVFNPFLKRFVSGENKIYD